MAERQQIPRLGGASGILAAANLTTMTAIGLVSGSRTTDLLQPADRHLALGHLPGSSTPVQTITTLIDLSALVCAGAFLGLAALVWPRSRRLASVAVIFARATALLDSTGQANLTASSLRSAAFLAQPEYSYTPCHLPLLTSHDQA
jgi:hypothetical protein